MYKKTKIANRKNTAGKTNEGFFRIYIKNVALSSLLKSISLLNVGHDIALVLGAASVALAANKLFSFNDRNNFILQTEGFLLLGALSAELDGAEGIVLTTIISSIVGGYDGNRGAEFYFGVLTPVLHGALLVSKTYLLPTAIMTTLLGLTAIEGIINKLSHRVDSKVIAAITAIATTHFANTQSIYETLPLSVVGGAIGGALGSAGRFLTNCFRNRHAKATLLGQDTLFQAGD